MPASVSSAYSIVEPHPSAVPSKSYIYSGRGGAGNVTRAPANVTSGPSATGPAARASFSSLSKPRTTYSSGRGGAGNVHNATERAIFSFDEELQRQMSQESRVAPVFHVGRGGAGNVRSEQTNAFAARRNSNSSRASTSSAESGADIATRKIRDGWRKMAGLA